MILQIPDNERKACDAVARAIERIKGVTRANAYSPEDSGQNSQVEYVFTLSNAVYACEHTLVEAFDGQLKAGLDFENFVEPITSSLDNNMPKPGVYYLDFSIDPTNGFKKVDYPSLSEAVSSWVSTTATKLHSLCPTRPSRHEMPRGHKSAEKAEVHGIVVQLRRETSWSIAPRHDGRLFAGRFAPDNYENLRHARIARAVGKKLPKLMKCKMNGARSLLILENQDLALTNHFSIASAIEEALRGRDEVPDEIWLVDTTHELNWTVWCIISDGKSFPFGDGEYRYFEFDPATLVSV